MPRVVVVAPMTSELERWVSHFPLGSALPFLAGAHPDRPPLRWNATLGVLGLTTGMGPSRASTSVSALGYDGRFDLRFTTWLIAGIAGVDPAAGSLGSVFWASRLVSVDGGSYVDGLGHVPMGRTPEGRYAPPLPTRAEAERSGNLYLLDPTLVALAFHASEGVALRDTPRLRRARENYTQLAARQPPSVCLGDSTTSAYFWAGATSNEWAANASFFYSCGAARAATSDEEDAAVAEALGSLQRAGRANRSRLLVLRAASDYTYPPAGTPIEDWFFRSGDHFAEEEAYDALLAAGAPAVRALLRAADERPCAAAS